MERKRGGSLKRKLSLMLAMLLVVTGIPMDTVYATELDNDPVIENPIEEKEDSEAAANAENSDKKEEEDSVITPTEKEDGKEAVAGETEEGGNEETQTPADETVETHTAAVPAEIDEVAVTVYVKNEAGEYVAYEEEAIAVGTEIWLALDMEAEELSYITVNGSKVEAIEVDEAEVLCYNIEVEEDFDIDIEANYDEVAEMASSTYPVIGRLIYSGKRSISAVASVGDWSSANTGSNVIDLDTTEWENDADLVYTLSSSTQGVSLDYNYQNIKVKYDGNEVSEDDNIIIANTDDGKIKVTIKPAFKTSRTDSKSITLEVNDLYGIELDTSNLANLDGNGYVSVVDDSLTYGDGDNHTYGAVTNNKVTVQVSVALSSAALDNGQSVEKVVATFSDDKGWSIPINLTKNDDTWKYSYDISSKIVTSSNNIKLKLSAVMKTAKTVTVSAKSGFVKDGNSNNVEFLPFALYKYNTADGYYKKIAADQSIYEGDNLAVVIEGCENLGEDWAKYLTVSNGSALTAVTEKIALEDGSTTSYAYLIDNVSSSVSVTATLTKDIVVFEQGDYSISIGSTTVDLSKGDYYHVTSKNASDSETITIKPSGNNSLTSVKVDGTEEFTYTSENAKSFALNLTYGDNTAVQNVSVSTGDGYTLNIEALGKVNVATNVDDDNYKVDGVGSCLVEKNVNTTLYIKLTTSSYKVYNDEVTVTNKKTGATSTVKVHSYKGLGANETIYTADLGVLTADTAVSLSAVLKDSEDVYKVIFSGSNFTATVNDTGDTNSYKAGFPYSGKFAVASTDADGTKHYTAKNIVLTANAGYRFTSISESNVTVSDDGRKATITGVLPDNFYDNLLTITAATEKTVNLTVSGSGFTPIFTEYYEYHYDKDGSTDNLVDKVTSGVSDYYPVALDKNIELKITVDNTDTDKVASITIGDNELTVDDSDGANGNYTTSFTLNDLKIKEDATITVSLAKDEGKLQGISFVKEHYSVSGSQFSVNQSDFNTNEKVLVLSSTPINKDATVTFTVNPETNYTIKQLKYDGYTIYPTVDDELNDYFTVSNSGTAVTVTIKNVEENNVMFLTKGEQKDFVVVTQADGLTDTDISGGKSFTVVKPSTVTAADGTTKLFDADEILYYVNGLVSKDKTVSDKYTLQEGADTIDFIITAADELEISLKFYDQSGTDVTSTITVDHDGNTFTVGAKALLNVTKVEIEKKILTNDVTFNYPNGLVNITAKGYVVNSSDVEATDEDGNKLADGSYVKTFKVRKGKSIIVDVKAKTDAKITSIDGQDFEEDSASFEVVASAESTTINVKAEAVTSPIVTDNNKNVLEAEDDGTYFISYGSYYYLSVKKAGDIVSLDKAEVEIDGVSTELSIDSSKEFAKFYPEQKYAGKQAVVTLQHKNEAGNLDNVASFKFVIANVLTEVDVEGVVNGILTQTVDTKARYAIEIPEGTSIKDLKVSFTGLEDVTIENDELVVITAAKAAGENVGTISLENGRTTLKTIQVNTSKVVGVEKATANIAYVASTSKAIKVELSAAGVPDVDLNAGVIAYKVDVKVPTGASISGSLFAQKTFYVPKTGDSQFASLIVFKDDATKDYTFDVDVQLVQLNCKVDEDTYKTELDKPSVLDQSAITSVTGSEEYVLKSSYYTNAEELKLTEITNVVYRGQSGVAIADVDFGDKTSHIEDATVYFINANGTKYIDEHNANEANEYGYVAYNKLYVNVPQDDLKVGTYTVVVEASVGGKENVVPATASMTVKVEEGVWDLELENVPNTLYKASKKAASFKATAKLNNGATSGIKNKNVTWEIYKNVSGDVYTPITEKDALYGMVTVKNGTVTVNKAYEVSNSESKNTFYVVATSAANPNAKDVEKVVITNEALEISAKNFVLVEYDSANNEYKALPDQTSITSDKLVNGNISIVAVKDSRLNKSKFTVDDFLTYTLSTKSSNKNLKVTSYERVNSSGEAVYVYRLYAETTAKNVKVTFITMDGGKKSAYKIFTVDYANMDNLVLEVAGSVTSTYKFAGTTEDTLKVKLGYKDKDGGFHNFEGALNAKVSIKNGKILSSDTIDNVYVIKLTKDEAVFSVTDKATKNVTSCTIINTAYSKTAVPAVTADKKQIVANSVDEQTLTYTFKKATDYKYVKVQVDYTDRLKLEKKDAYGYSIYDDFLYAIGANYDYVILPIENGSFTLTFGADDDGYKAVPAGAYKLYFSYGDYKSSEFIPATKAGKVTIKAVASGKAEYEVKTSYELSLKDTINTELTATLGKNTTVKFVGAKSTIVDGQPNAFARLFTVNKKTGELTLRPYSVLKDETVSDKDKTKLTAVVEKYAGAATGSVADLTGYVEYRVNGNKNTELAKVTVTLSKEALKSYSASEINMLAGSNVVSEVTIKGNGKEVEVVKAASTGSFTASAANGKVSMKSGTIKEGSSSASVTIIPSTSFYATNTSAKADSTYGIEVPVSVNAVSTYSPVVTLDSNSVAFDVYDGSSSGTYKAEIPYTSNIANTITNKSFSFVDSADAGLKNYLTLTAEDGMLCLNMTKAKMESAVDAGLVSYGASKNIKLTVKYCGLVEETYPVNVTFPGKASFNAEDIFTNIRKALWNDLAGNPDNAEAYVFPGTVDFTEALEAKENGVTGAELDAKYEEAFEAAVTKAVKAQFVAGANIAIAKDGVEATVSGDSVKATVKLTGSDVNNENAKVSAVYTVGTNHHGINGNTYTIETAIALPDSGNLLATYKSKLANFVNNTHANHLNGLVVSNDLTVDAIVAAANAYVLDGASSIYGISAQAANGSTLDQAIEKATAIDEGSIKFVLVLKEKGIEVHSVDVDETISTLISAADLAGEFRVAFEAAKPYFNVTTTGSEIKAMADDIIAAHNNPNVKADYASDGGFTWVETNIGNDETMKTGFTLTMVFADETAKANIPVKLTVDFKFSGTNVDNHITAQQLFDAVDGAIGSTGKANAYFTNKSETSKANILEAAQKALGNAPYKVDIEWDWVQAPTHKANGNVVYTIKFTALDGGSSEVAEQATALASQGYEQIINKSDAYQSFTEAKADIMDAFLKAKFDELKDTWLDGNGDIKSDEVLTFIRKCVTDGYDADTGNVVSTEKADGRYMTVEYVSVADKYFTQYIDDCQYTPAELNAEGSVKAIVVLTEMEDDEVVYSEVLTLNKTIDSKPQDWVTAVARLASLTITSKTEKSDIYDWLDANIKAATAKATITKFDKSTKTCVIYLEEVDGSRTETKPISW